MKRHRKKEAMVHRVNEVTTSRFDLVYWVTAGILVVIAFIILMRA